MKIRTNNHLRPIVDAWDLPIEARSEFDYLDWSAIERGEESASFVRYGGQWHDLGEFSRIIAPDAARMHPMECAAPEFQGWSGYRSDSFYSGVLVRYVDDETIIVATYVA